MSQLIDSTAMEQDDGGGIQKRPLFSETDHLSGNGTIGSPWGTNRVSKQGIGEVINTSFDMSTQKHGNRVSLENNDCGPIQVVSSWDENEEGATNAILDNISHVANTPRSCLKGHALAFDGFETSNYLSSTTSSLEGGMQISRPFESINPATLRQTKVRQQPSSTSKTISKQTVPSATRRFMGSINYHHNRLSSSPGSQSVAVTSGSSTPASFMHHLNNSSFRTVDRKPANMQISSECQSASSVSRIPGIYYSDHLFDPHDSTPVVGNKRPPKRSLGTTTTATASSSLLETTNDTIDSVDIHESTTPFRFTSFPASLPRIHNNPDSSTAFMLCPGTIRKRMSFGAGLNHSREDDGTHNTSVSSIHDDNGCSDDDSAESPLVTRTRLNFNSVTTPLALTPKLAFDGDDESVDDVFDCSDEKIDLSRPYDHHRNNSFASSVSSLTKNLSTSEDVLNQAHLRLTPSRNACSRGELESLQPQTPNELRIHFQLDAAQCSPIQGIPEEEGEASSKSVACSSKKPRKELGNMSCSRLSSQSSSGSSDQSSRPLPELYAFDASERCRRQHSQNQAVDLPGSTVKHALALSPRLLCPPTPVRTPAWAQRGGGYSKAVANPMRIARSNSLIATKVLATCSDGRVAINSVMVRGDGVGIPMLLSDDGSAGLSPFRSTHERADSTNMTNAITTNESEDAITTSLATTFEVLSTLGKGNFADVYRVRSKLDGQLYAVKRNRRRFRGRRDRDAALSEVRIMQLLQSNHERNTGSHEHNDSSEQFSHYLLPFFQAWQEDGHFFCQTELCCRDTCREMIDFVKANVSNTTNSNSASLSFIGSPLQCEADGFTHQLPEDVVWKVCHDISAGLAHMHSRKVVHNDIKPSNILFRLHPALGVVCKIGDFGMTRATGSKEDGQEGDQKYMAQELLHTGVTTPMVDIFSLGLTMYELASTMSFTVPSDGPRWHAIRSGSEDLHIPTSRSKELINLIKKMISPEDKTRPCANLILLNESVIQAGRVDSIFLRDYVQMIEEHDKKHEEIALQSEQTPRTSTRQICSPTFGGFLPNLLTDLSSPNCIPTTHTA